MLEEIKSMGKNAISRACRVMSTSRSSMSYLSVKDDSALAEKLQDLAKDHPREGFWKFYFRIRNKGEIINHKRVHRVYKKIGLSQRRKHRKRLAARVKEPLLIPPFFTHTWSIDFMSDALQNGQKFRTFNIIDDYNREVLFIEIDYSLKSSRVIWVLRHLISRFGKPKKIRMDNGPEFIARMLTVWGEVNGIELKYIQPGKPTQNGYIERFNGSYRDGVLDACMFTTLEDVRNETDKWVFDFNNYRPHDSLGGIAPIAYRKADQLNQLVPSGGRSASAQATPSPSLHAPQRELMTCSKK
jgi:putative transposase